ncbi:MAG: helix-turn-helix transcriptional regulator [Clostridia bacterium]|nr:helix-turn-helix transcriptional regulator [Clostridia bacterium]
MKIRKQEYGNCNVVGKNIEELRKKRGLKQKDFISRLQTMGVDINPTSYSKLEGQVRYATDIELYAIAKILGVSIDSLFEKKHDKEEIL